MKSYIYIVITKELFRRSIAGINGAAGGDPTPLPPNPGSHRSGTLWDYVPVPAAGGGAALLCLGWGRPKKQDGSTVGLSWPSPHHPAVNPSLSEGPPDPPPGYLFVSDTEWKRYHFNEIN